MSSDKVALSWNDYSSSGSFIGEQTWIIEKADVVAGSSSPRAWPFGVDSIRFGLVPAVTQGALATQYLIYNDAGLGSNTTYHSVGVVTITGTPAAGNVVWTESNPAVTATLFPPPAQQPQGPPVDTGDDRFLSAVWQNNVLWVGGDDGCTPTSDTTLGSCLRLIQISTAGTTPTIMQDFDVATSGNYLAYPALALDGSRNLFFGFSAIGPDTYGSALTSGQLAGTTSLVPPILLKAGEGPYSGFDPSIGANRWGDYSGAAVDPADPSVGWVAAEYAATSTDPFNWGTEIGTQVGAAAPDTTAPVISGVRDSPDPFSPNGDGRQDKVHIYWRVSERAVVTTTIATKNGTVVQVFKVFATQGNWFDEWNGRNRGGHLEKPGTYVYSIQAVDAAGNQSRVVRGTVTVEG